MSLNCKHKSTNEDKNPMNADGFYGEYPTLALICKNHLIKILGHVL